jgi:hypothetical protein
MAKSKVKFTMTVYVAVWSKGATKEFAGESQPPIDFQPLECIELSDPYMYYNVKEERAVWANPVAVFASKEEADGWLDKFDANSKSFEIREAKLQVF